MDYLEKGRLSWFQSLFRVCLPYSLNIFRRLVQVYRFSLLICYPCSSQTYRHINIYIWILNNYILRSKYSKRLKLTLFFRFRYVFLHYKSIFIYLYLSISKSQLYMSMQRSIQFKMYPILLLIGITWLGNIIIKTWLILIAKMKQTIQTLKQE